MAQQYQSYHQHGGHYQPGYQTMSQDHSSVYLGAPTFNGFDDKHIRAQFVSKVYSIVAVQLLITSAIVAWFCIHEPTKEYMQVHGAPYLYAAFGLNLIVYMILICVESARRSFPINFILLALLTLGYALIAAVLSSRFSTYTVLCAAGATASATIIMGLLAKYSSFDITTCGCGLCLLGLIHMILAIVLILVLVPLGYAKTGSLIIAGLGAFLISLYMMFDLQLIMGGRSAELSPEEYILGAVILYVDIVQFFQYMLIIFGRND